MNVYVPCLTSLPSSPRTLVSKRYNPFTPFITSPPLTITSQITSLPLDLVTILRVFVGMGSVMICTGEKVTCSRISSASATIIPCLHEAPVPCFGRTTARNCGGNSEPACNLDGKACRQKKKLWHTKKSLRRYPQRSKCCVSARSVQPKSKSKS